MKSKSTSEIDNQLQSAKNRQKTADPEENETKILGGLISHKTTNPGKESRYQLIILLVFTLLLIIILGLWLKANAGLVTTFLAGSGIKTKLWAWFKKIRSP